MSNSGSLVLMRDSDEAEIEVRSMSAGSGTRKRQRQPSPAASVSLQASRSGSVAMSPRGEPRRETAKPKYKAYAKVKKPKTFVPVRAVPVRPAVYAEPDEGDYEELINPSKRRPARQEVESQGGSGEYEMSERFDDGGAEGGQEQDVKPSEGYKTIDDEKHELLLKLFRLKEKGYPVRAFTLSSDILDMRTDYAKASYTEDMSSGLDFCKDTVNTLTNALEKFNRMYDPFDLKLDGFAQHMYVEVFTRKKFDNVFEKLIAKYRTSVSCPPELLFLFMYGSMALTFHMAHSQSNVLGPELSAAMKRDPGIMERVLQEVRKSEAGYSQPPPPQHPQHANPLNRPPAPVPTRREMRGPGIDMSMLAGMAGMLPFGASVRQSQPPLTPQAPPVYDPNPSGPAADIESIPESFNSDDRSDGSDHTKEVLIEAPKKRGRKPRNVGNVVQIK